MLMKFILVGPHANKTIKLGNFKFTSGTLVMTGTGTELESISKVLSFYQAYPEGSKELAAARAFHAKAKEEKDGSRETDDQEGEDDDPVGEDGTAAPQEPAGPGYASDQAAGEGVQGASEGGRAEAPVDERLYNILSSLDPANDEHWTQAGKPRLSVIEEAYGSTNLTRADLDAAMPGWDREAATKRAKELAEI